MHLTNLNFDQHFGQQVNESLSPVIFMKTSFAKTVLTIRYYLLVPTFVAMKSFVVLSITCKINNINLIDVTPTTW